MRTYSEADIRDVALIGHGGSGKTSLAEAILFDTKAVTRLGRVDDETSNLDTEPEEKKRKGTINPHIAAVEWQKSKINFVDTSGHGNFLIDTQIAMDVVDAALILVSAPDGVQVVTERAWEMVEGRKLARAIVIGKLDRERASFQTALDDILPVIDGSAGKLKGERLAQCRGNRGGKGKPIRGGGR